MKKQLNLFLIVLLVCLIYGCGSGSTSPSTSNNIVQIIKLNFNNVKIANQTVSYGDNAATTLFNNVFGGYSESDGTTQLFEQANNSNTKSIYNFDTFNQINLAPSVSAYNILYKTPTFQLKSGAKPISTTVSGLIIIPNGIKIKGVVLYFHGTFLGKNEVPSCLGDPLSGTNEVASNLPTYCHITALDSLGALTFMNLSHIFASHGYAVVAPDYLGKGYDYNNVEPYVTFPDINVLTAFNMFPALRTILARDYKMSPNKELPLYITGISEGGGFALDAAKLVDNGQYAPLLDGSNIKLKITSPQDGAYSMPDQVNFELANLNDGFTNCAESPSYSCGLTNMMNSADTSLTSAVQTMNKWRIGSALYAAGDKPTLMAYTLTAINYYVFNNSNAGYDDVMNHNFWSHVQLDDGTIATLYDLFSGVLGSKYTGSQIAAAITNNASLINNYNPSNSVNINFYYDNGILFTQPIQTQPLGQNNSVSLFANANTLQNSEFTEIFANASTYNWHALHPINFINLQYDSVVAPLNYLQAYSCMKNGISYTDNINSSVGNCDSSSASPSAVAQTEIPNFPITNSIDQLSPINIITNTVNSNANSKFWTNQLLTIPPLYSPIDHQWFIVLGNIIALCTFENNYNNGINSGYCPN